MLARKTMRKPPALKVENLERRELLAASFQHGVLTVRAHAAAETIVVDLNPRNPTMLRAFENGHLVGTKSLATVHQIRLIGHGTGNFLKIDQSHGPIRVAAALNGGSGTKNRLQGGAGLNTYQHGVAVDAARPFGSAQALRKFLSHGAGRLGLSGSSPTGLKGGNTAPAPTAPGATTNTTSHSTTNVQVAGVNETDTVQTDGNSLFILSNNNLVVVSTQPAAIPTVTSTTAVEGSPIGEYLNGNRLTVLSSIRQTTGLPPIAANGGGLALPMLWIWGSGQVKVTVFDISDSTKAPQLVQETKVDGSYNDSRMINGKLDLVVQNDLFAGLWRGGPIALAGGTARPSVVLSNPAKRLANASLDQLLPTFSATSYATGTAVSGSGLLVQPQDILQPTSGTDANLLSLVVLDTTGSNPSPVGAVALLGSYSSTLYVTPDALYIFSPNYDDSGDTTNIAEFSLNTPTPTLVATGSVPGSLLNQFSADARAGYLRVATTLYTTDTSDNGVYVLQQQGDQLNIVGSIDKIAPGDSLSAARFIGNEVYLSTSQVAPFIGIDLTNPTNPTIAGSLNLPNGSEFLQPLGTTGLLSIGQQIDPSTGDTLGLQLSLFNVSEQAKPTLVATRELAPSGSQWTWSNAEWDPHALGIFPELGVVAIPVSGSGPVASDPTGDTWQTISDLYVFQVDAARGLTLLGTIDHTSTVERSVRIGDVIYSIADNDVKSVRVGAGLTPLGTVTLPADASGGGGPKPILL